MNPIQLAETSNALVVSAMAVYGLALVLHALGAGLRSRSGRGASTLPLPAVGASARVPAGVAVGDAVGGITGGSLDAPASAGGGAPPGHTRPWAPRVGRVAVSLTVLGFLLHLGAVLARGAAAERVPWGNMYEFSLTGSLAATGAYLVLMWRGWTPVRELGVWIQSLVLLSLGLATAVLYTPAGDLVPALDSAWLVVHVVAAVVSGGIFTVGAVAAVALLLRSRRGSPQGNSRQERTGLARLVHVTHLVAFPLWTFAVIAGAIWAENAWGRYWGWDPKETWAFITWVFYAAYLHAESTAGWSGRRAAWFALAGYFAFLFNYFGVNLWITGLHSYAGV